MSSTTFQDFQTPILASWLNDVNGVAYSKKFPDATHAQTAEALSAPTGSSLVGFQPAGTGAAARTVQDKARESVSVLDFMTAAQIADVQAGTITLDITAAINAAVTSLGGIIGGKVFMPRGRYKTTSMITLPSGIILCGEGSHGGNSAQRQAATSIYAVHTQAAIISLAGANGVTLEDIGLQSDSVTYPKTGLMLGRTSAASSGYHKISRVSVYGYFSVAVFYSIASEDNLWTDIYGYIYGGAAKYCFYTGEADLLAVASLTASSNLENTLIRPWLLNTSTDANSAGIYIECTQATGSWTFIGGYMTMNAGSYIQLNASPSAGVDQLGPFTFLATSGERYSGGDPLYGYRLSASSACDLIGLNILGGRFDFQAGNNHYQIYQSPNVYLRQPNITLQAPEAVPYAQTAVIRTQIYGGMVNVGRVTEGEAATLINSWVNAFEAPWAQAGWWIDGFGVLHCRGTVANGTGGIFTLPAGYWPSVNMYFIVYAGGGVGRVSVSSTTGLVNFLSGSNTEVDLSSICFKIN